MVDDFLLMSAYPGHPDPIIHQKTIASIMNAGINTFIQLQTNEEAISFNPYQSLIIDEEIDWEDDLYSSYTSHSSRWKREVTFTRVQVADRGVISDELALQVAQDIINAIGEGHRILVHCRGGKGRSGVIICLVLGLLYDMNSEKAMNVAQMLFERRQDQGRKMKKIPQTRKQVEQVKRLLN